MATLGPDVEILTWLAEFGNPSTEDIDFNAIIGGELPAETRELLLSSTNQRRRMIEALSYEDVKVDPRNVVAAVDAYLPSVWRITASLEASADANIKLNKKLEFSWTSKLSKTKKDWKFGVLVFEIAYTLMVRSLAHVDTAKSILVSSKSAPGGMRLTDAVTELRMGAGIQHFVADDLLPRWVNPPEKRPHEVLLPVVTTLELMLQASAQRLAIAKAIIGNSPPSMIAKLMIGCIGRYDAAIRTLRTLDRESFEGINDTVRDELGTIPALLRALTSKYLAMAAHSKGKFGEAVSFAGDAVRRIREVAVGRTMEEALKESVRAEQKLIEEMFAAFREENDKVYFDAVVPGSELVVPDGQFIVKSIDYVLPDSNLVSFVEVNTTASSLKSANVAPPAPRSTRSFYSKPAKPVVTSSGLRAPPGVDAEAFASLPEEIQREVIAQHESSTGGAATIL